MHWSYAFHYRVIPKNVIHDDSDRGVQYLSILSTHRLEVEYLRAPISTTGDSYDNALAEKVNGLNKTEVIVYLKAVWQGLSDAKYVTLNGVDRFNKKRVQKALDLCIAF